MYNNVYCICVNIYIYTECVNVDVNINWLVVEPTHLKNMLVKSGSSSPKFGV